MMTSKIERHRFHIHDFLSGTVVFLVALPLCLGIALASGAPILSGIIAGIVGGILVGALSGSHISVAGPAAGLTTVILVQLELLGGNYAAFLLCIVLPVSYRLDLAYLGSVSLPTLFRTMSYWVYWQLSG